MIGGGVDFLDLWLTPSVGGADKKEAVGWRERDYAKFTDEEWRILYGPAERGPVARRASVGLAGGTRRGFAWGSAILGAAAVLLVLAAAAMFPRSHPLLSRLDLRSLTSRATQPSLHHRYPLRLPRQAQTGARLILTGSIPRGVSGPITVEAHWNSQPWQRLSVIPVASTGAYRGAITLDRTGMLNVRLRISNGDVMAGSIRVTR